MNVDEAQRPVRLFCAALAGLIGGLILAASIIGAADFERGGMLSGQDARAYWQALRGTGYEAQPGSYGAYLYSPAYVQVLSPVLSLGWQQFLALWTLMLMGALLVLSGPLLFTFVLPFAFFELWGGNIHLLLALAVVIGFRYPAAWSFVLLTKVTPGIGLLWFVGRREWRQLAVAVTATAAIVAVSWSIDPVAWRSWLDLLVREAGRPPPPGSIAIPLAVRLPIAAAVALYAGVAGRRWLVPVAALAAMPVLWWGSLTMLAAIVAIERPRLEEAFLRRVSALELRRRSTRPLGGWATEPEG